METTENRGSEQVANYFQPVCPTPVNGTPLQHLQDQIVDQQNVKYMVQDVLNKRIARNPKYACTNIVIDKATLHCDENLTVVVVECYGEQLIGWSKFNPKDVRYLEGVSKKGNYWFRKESKFRDKAGIMKAIDRVVDKLLNP